MADWPEWLYIGACLVVPAAWGAFSAWLFGRFDRSRSQSDDREPMDYVI